ncbi:MAG: hypothetical protein NTY06_03100, partial [Candidatus Gottesmanbacteria bacterium]|nr:hypothetical protein [Candidatus Gottesmanbacteria bacterium]
FLIGVMIQTVQALPSAFIFRDGWHSFIADDSLWHLGLTGELTRHMPPFQPGSIGMPLKNYHYLANLFSADVTRVFGLPLLVSQFFFTYILLSAMLGLLLFVLGRMAGLSMLGATLLMYLQYFASDIIYLIPLWTRHVIDFTVHPLEDGTMFLENPPRAFASVFTVLGIIMLYQTVRSKRVWPGILTGIVFGIIIGCKIHSGIMVLLGLAGFGVYALVKKQWFLLWPPLIALVISVIIYFPTNAGAGGPVFASFEMARMFAAQPGLAISFLELRRQIYAAHNNGIRVLEMNMIMLVLFYIAQFGFRTIGWFGWKYAGRSFGTGVSVFLVTALIGTTVFATLFIQPVTYADIFNSYLAVSVVLSILTALIVERMLRNRSQAFKMIIIVFVGLLTLPRIVYRMDQFIRQISHSRPFIPTAEIQTMDFVRRSIKSGGVIYVFNAGQTDGYASYVSALTGYDTFLSGQNYLSRHAVDYKAKQQIADIIATGSDPNIVGTLLKQYNIGILYAYKPFVMPEGLAGLGLRKVFENGTNILFTYEHK